MLLLDSKSWIYAFLIFRWSKKAKVLSTYFLKNKLVTYLPMWHCPTINISMARQGLSPIVTKSDLASQSYKGLLFCLCLQSWLQNPELISGTNFRFIHLPGMVELSWSSTIHCVPRSPKWIKTGPKKLVWIFIYA